MEFLDSHICRLGRGYPFTLRASVVWLFFPNSTRQTLWGYFLVKKTKQNLKYLMAAMTTSRSSRKLAYPTQLRSFSQGDAATRFLSSPSSLNGSSSMSYWVNRMMGSNPTSSTGDCFYNGRREVCFRPSVFWDPSKLGWTSAFIRHAGGLQPSTIIHLGDLPCHCLRSPLSSP